MRGPCACPGWNTIPLDFQTVPFVCPDVSRLIRWIALAGGQAQGPRIRPTLPLVPTDICRPNGGKGGVGTREERRWGGDPCGRPLAGAAVRRSSPPPRRAALKAPSPPPLHPRPYSLS